MNFKKREPPRSKTVQPGVAVADGAVDEPSTTMYVTRFRRSLMQQHEAKYIETTTATTSSWEADRNRAVSEAAASGAEASLCATNSDRVSNLEHLPINCQSIICEGGYRHGKHE
jgi:hypothetical protein